VLRRVVDQTPQLGFIRPGALDYEAYRRELETVMPRFGCFAAVPQASYGAELLPVGLSEDTRLAVETLIVH
jgi:hypothetical protein